MITSIANPKIKHVRSLRQRKHRDASGLLFVDGLRAFETLQLARDVETLIVAPDLLTARGRQLLARAQHERVRIEEVSQRVFASLTTRENPDGIGAVVRQRWMRLEDVVVAPKDILIALHSVRDPRNIGAVLRVAEAVGVSGVLLLDDSVDPYSPEAVRASTGAVFGLDLVRASFKAFNAWRRSLNLTCVATAADAPHEYTAVRYPRPIVLLMGSERAGLSDSQRLSCEIAVRIPMVGRVTSLNVAVAAAVVLYEIFNQGRNLSHA